MSAETDEREGRARQQTAALTERLLAEQRRKLVKRAKWEWVVFAVVAGVLAVVWWRWK